MVERKNFDLRKRWLEEIQNFNPSEGEVVLQPPRQEAGFWAGGASVIYDDELSKFYIYYRLRNAKTGGPEERGFECRIGESTDGIHFKDIWTAKKEQFNSNSIERASLVKTKQGTYRLYISYDQPKDSTVINTWKIDLLEADNPRNFDVKKRKKILYPDSINVHSVKDPWIMLQGNKYIMVVCYTLDGLVERSGLATSEDGYTFNWQGEILSPGTGWDADCTRITSMIWCPLFFLVFYDGRPTHKEVFEERPGLAITFDLKKFHKVSSDKPLFENIRYVEILPVGDEIFLYYEFTNSLGAHEYRLKKFKK